MSNWRAEYFSALGVRDEREKANEAIYHAYTRLADRTSHPQSQPNTGTISSSASPSDPHRTSSPTPGKKGIKQDPSLVQAQRVPDLLIATRQDLAEAQKLRSELSDRLTKTATELDKLKKKANLDGKRIADLLAERTHLQLRLRDQDEELRGKAKLLDSVQNELVSLNLQFNMAEDRAKRLEKENQELIDRWMDRMGKEADAMNNASKFS